MSQNVSDNVIQQANRLIAIDVINDRLAVEPTEDNVACLMRCFTQLEVAVANKKQGG